MARQYDPIHAVIERVGAEYPSPSTFFGYELDEWPEGTVRIMVSCGLLLETSRARAAVCNGCEYACHKLVNVRTKSEAQAPTGFIVCDEEPELGRIPVPMDRLRRFRAAIDTVGRTVAGCLELDPSRAVTERDRVVIGNIRGRYGLRELALEIRGHGLVLTVGTQARSLTDLLAWTQGRAVIDRREIARMANRKARSAAHLAAASGGHVSAAAGGRASSLSKRDLEILRHGKLLRAQGKSWPKVADEIAKLTFIKSPKDGLRPISAATVRRILTKLLSERTERG